MEGPGLETNKAYPYTSGNGDSGTCKFNVRTDSESDETHVLTVLCYYPSHSTACARLLVVDAITTRAVTPNAIVCGLSGPYQVVGVITVTSSTMHPRQ